MLRPEMKQPKNAAGMVLVLLSIVTMIAAYIYTLPEAAVYIAAGFYIAGMVLIVIPGRAADPDHDHQERGNNE